MTRPSRSRPRSSATPLATLLARLLHPRPAPPSATGGLPAPAAASVWLGLRDALREFRAGGRSRVQLVSLARVLRDGQMEDGERFLSRLLELVTAFRMQTLPELEEVAALAAREPWSAEQARRFASDCAQLAELPARLAPSGRPARGQLAAAEDSLRLIVAELHLLQQRVDAMLAESTEQLPAQICREFAARGLKALLSLEGDWRQAALIANPDELAEMLDLLARLHRGRLRGRPPLLWLRLQLEPNQLLLASRDRAPGPAPTESELERLGLRALAGRLHCGLRCRAGEVQLAFPLADRGLAAAARAPG